VITIISADKPSSKIALLPVFKISLVPVLYDSMEPVISKGDLVIAKAAEDKTALKTGDIITFLTVVNGEKAVNIRRIIEVTTNEAGDETVYITKGDNAPEGITEKVYSKDVLAVYSSSIKGAGSVIVWLQKPANFFMVIMIPLVFLFLLNGCYFAKMLMNYRLKIALLKAVSSEDDIKRRAIEEYVASQKAGQNEAK
jgi:signal peptidase